LTRHGHSGWFGGEGKNKKKKKWWWMEIVVVVLMDLNVALAVFCFVASA
jgi:hypothetical protein